nr:DUF2029 domain-containing protein [Propionibacterium sp.]
MTRWRDLSRLTGASGAWPALLLAGVVLVAAWLVKSPCMDAQPVSAGWVGFDQRPIVSTCYNDIVLLYRSHQLDSWTFPYASVWEVDGTPRFMEYPVITGVFMWLAASLARLVGGGVASVALYFTVTCLLLGGLWLGAVRAYRSVVGPGATLLLATSPLLVVHAFTNWDLLPMGLVVAALVAFRSGRPVLTGVFIGLGTAAKLFSILVLGPLLVLAVRRTIPLRQWAAIAGSALATWLAANLPVLVLYPAAWGEFFRMNSERPPEWNSIYFIASRVAGRTFPVVNLVSLVLFAGLCLAILWVALRARAVPQVSELMVLVLAAFLLSNKVWSPQYSLWLLPFVFLAVDTLRPLLAWQATEITVWLTLTPLLGPVAGAGDATWFLVSAVVRDACLVFICLAVLRRMRRRGSPVDDPFLPGSPGGTPPGARWRSPGATGGVPS